MDMRASGGQQNEADVLRVHAELAPAALERGRSEGLAELALVHLPGDPNAFAPVSALAGVLLVVGHGNHGEGLGADEHQLERVAPVVVFPIVARVDHVERDFVLADADHAHEACHDLGQRTQSSVTLALRVRARPLVERVRGAVGGHVHLGDPLAVRDVDLAGIGFVGGRHERLELHLTPQCDMCARRKAIATLPVLPIA